MIENMKLKNLLIIACVFLLLALLPMPYGYYQLLRLIVCGVSIWAIMSGCDRNETLILLFVLVVLLYNPIFVVHFDRTIWSVLNVLTAVFFCYSAKITCK